jgi:hypothetical protein
MAAQQWRRSNGGGGAAMVVDRSHRRVWYHRIVPYSVFVYQIDILRSFLRRPHFLMKVTAEHWSGCKLEGPLTGEGAEGQLEGWMCV